MRIRHVDWLLACLLGAIFLATAGAAEARGLRRPESHLRAHERAVHERAQRRTVFHGFDRQASKRFKRQYAPSRELDNGRVRVGVDLGRGGSIAELAEGGGPNLVNVHDLGREIQPSYYAGPGRFGSPASPWEHTPWNPVAAGDRFGHGSRVLDFSNDGRTIYTKSVPFQWALDAVPCACLLEQWISLDGRAVHVTTRLTNLREDTTQYDGIEQELPAVYVTSRLHHLVSYTGMFPYTDEPTREISGTFPTNARWIASEHWSAAVDDAGRGIGVFAPTTTAFEGGLYGEPGGGSTADATMYLAPRSREQLDHNITFETSYTLVVGTVGEIRTFAYSHRTDDRPAYVFQSDRQHWSYAHAADSGWPVHGYLRVDLSDRDPQLLGPVEAWRAESVPRLRIAAAFHNTHQDVAQLFWRSSDQPFSEEQSTKFRIIGDGVLHEYVIDLSSSPAYKGIISQLRLDPVYGRQQGAFVDVASITAADGS